MFELYEHKADMGIRARAPTLEQAFAEGAKAMFEVMVDTKKVKTRKSVSFEAEAENLEELFVEFLNQLLYLKDVHDMFFSAFSVEKIEETEEGFKLKARAAGERMKRKDHDVKTEVKGATYSQLKVEKEKDGWMAQCVVDV